MPGSASKSVFSAVLSRSQPKAIIRWAFGGSGEQSAAEGAAGPEAGAPAGMEQQTVSCIKVLPASAVSGKYRLYLPAEFVASARLSPGTVQILDSADSDSWTATLQWHSQAKAEASDLVLRGGWRAVSDALCLREGQTVCLTALSPGVIRVSPNADAPPPVVVDPWPVIATLSRIDQPLTIPSKAARSIVTVGSVPVTLLVPSTSANESDPAEVEREVHLVRSGTHFYLGTGWVPVARELTLEPGEQVQLDLVSRDPWRLRLNLLPSEPVTLRSGTQRGAPGSEPKRAAKAPAEESETKPVKRSKRRRD